MSLWPFAKTESRRGRQELVPQKTHHGGSKGIRKAAFNNHSSWGLIKLKKRTVNREGEHGSPRAGALRMRGRDSMI